MVGISRDSVRAQRKFSDALCLPYPMACDEDGATCRAYGASGAISGMLGLARRVSVLLDGDGTVRRTYPDVAVARHADEVLGDLEALGMR